MTALLEAPTLTSQSTYEEVVGRWEEYRPGYTEQRLGIVPTALERVRVAGRHTLLAVDETVQPGNNFKYNGMAVAVDTTLRDHPHVDTFYIGSAGNAGAALVAAAERRGKRVVVETPDTLVDSKRALLAAGRSTVHAVHASVEHATATAQQKGEDDPYGKFVHAYDDIDAIAGQGLVAKRAMAGLLERHTRGLVDLKRDRVALLIQRGGGSLLTGFACALYDLKEKGVAGENVELYEVRPEESVPRYDGLHVRAPGSYANTLLADNRFVTGTVYVNDLDTGLAAGDAGRHFGKRFEPSGLAGVAAFEKLRSNTDEPTTFVTVLSGSNTSNEAYHYFSDTPRRVQAAALGSFATRSLEEVLAQPYDPALHWQPTPHYYGRHPAHK